MKRGLKIIGYFILGVILGLAWFVFRPETYLPHKKIVISVPFNISDPPIWIAPMGETVEHPNTPRGHPGIDFAWEKGAPTQILASADGKVSSVSLGTSYDGLYDVEIKHGLFYVTRYKELAKLEPNIKKGVRLKRGDLMGTAGTLANGFHWELASVSFARDRFCPMTYFDPTSKAMVQKIWDAIPNDNMFKKDFPDVCSGDYKDRAE